MIDFFAKTVITKKNHHRYLAGPEYVSDKEKRKYKVCSMFPVQSIGCVNEVKISYIVLLPYFLNFSQVEGLSLQFY